MDEIKVTGSIRLERYNKKNMAHFDKWNDFAKKHPDGHHHTSHYISAISRAFGHDEASVMAIDDADNVVGILPLTGIKSFVFGKQLTSIPFFNYGGPLAVSAEVENLLFNYAVSYAKKHNYDSVELRSLNPLPDDGMKKDNWFTHQHKAVMLLELPDDIRAIGAGNAKKRAKLRSQAGLAQRKCEEEGSQLHVAFGGDELIDGFYTVFSQHMRDLGTPVYGKKFFQHIYENIPSSLCVVYLNDKPVSCGWLFKHEHHDRVSIPWASTLREANGYSMNTFMYYKILEHCILAGTKTFDFGRSTIDAGTYKFKAQWGAVPTICQWHGYRIDGSKPEPRLATDQGKMGLIVNTWKKLPLPVANLLGPHIIKNIA